MTGVFTTGQVAKIFRVAPRTVAKWIDQGHLQGYRVPGSSDRRVSRNALRCFAECLGYPIQTAQIGIRPVLLISADTRLHPALQRLLPSDGYHIEVARDAFTAGAIAAQLKPHCIILDFRKSGRIPMSAPVRIQRVWREPRYMLREPALVIGLFDSAIDAIRYRNQGFVYNRACIQLEEIPRYINQLS